MRIEKVNDTQIRCTLTKEDLAERQIKLSELAYGTEKAKSLFRDMMQQAAFEFGFEADNIPLMIEAIPLSSESIILIITKVEYPEELDTRFSQFSPSTQEEDTDYVEPPAAPPLLEGAQEIMNLLNRLKETANSLASDSQTQTKPAQTTSNSSDSSSLKIPTTKLFVLDSLEAVEQAASVLAGIYKGQNDLYHNRKDARYYLFLHPTGHSSEEFNKVCNILSEYARQERFTSATEAFYQEHFETVVSPYALQTLSSL